MLDKCVWWVLDPAPYNHERYFYSPFDGRASPPADEASLDNNVEEDESTMSGSVNSADTLGTDDSDQSDSARSVDTDKDVTKLVPADPSIEARSLGPVDSNGSSVPLISRGFVPCSYPGNWGFEDHCYCFWGADDNRAVDRKWITAAIDAACTNYFTGGIGELANLR